MTKLFSSAYTLDAFHAHHDYPEVRRRFYSLIASLDVKIDVLVVDKLRCFPALKQNPGKLYGVMAGQLLKTICHQAENTEVIFSRRDSKLKSRQEIEVEVKKPDWNIFRKIPSSIAISSSATTTIHTTPTPAYKSPIMSPMRYSRCLSMATENSTKW